MSSGFLKATNMAPGDSTSSFLNVQNTGNLNFTYSVSSREESRSPDLFNQLQLRINDGNMTLYNGPLKSLKNLSIGYLEYGNQKPLTFTASFSSNVWLLISGPGPNRTAVNYKFTMGDGTPTLDGNHYKAKFDTTTYPVVNGGAYTATVYYGSTIECQRQFVVSTQGNRGN